MTKQKWTIPDKYRITLIIFTITLIITSCRTGTTDETGAPKTVSYVDLKKYAGTWYEIARYPNSFQKNCVGSMATYTLIEDGTMSVTNECREKSYDGKIISAKGKAKIVDKKTNAKLKVSFFWPFSGDYWIIDLDKDYNYAVVGHPRFKYLWILSRNKTMDEKQYSDILARLEKNYYDTSRLFRTSEQTPGTP